MHRCRRAACAGTVHSTYAVVLSTRDPNIPWYHGRCRWKRATSARTCCLYTFDIVVATPARVLSASSKKHASRGRQRGTTKQMPLVLYARVGEHARAVSPAATSTQDERANADWHGVKRRRVITAALKICGGRNSSRYLAQRMLRCVRCGRNCFNKNVAPKNRCSGRADLALENFGCARRKQAAANLWQAHALAQLPVVPRKGSTAERYRATYLSLNFCLK